MVIRTPEPESDIIVEGSIEIPSLYPTSHDCQLLMYTVLDVVKYSASTLRLLGIIVYRSLQYY